MKGTARIIRDIVALMAGPTLRGMHTALFYPQSNRQMEGGQYQPLSGMFVSWGGQFKGKSAVMGL